METGLYYLNKLSKADQVRFLRNFSKPEHQRTEEINIYQRLSSEYKTMDQFISTAFHWDSTPEGFWYWHTISNK
jgi:hypothetical protein